MSLKNPNLEKLESIKLKANVVAVVSYEDKFKLYCLNRWPSELLATVVKEWTG
jgi:hypothetical protein